MISSFRQKPLIFNILLAVFALIAMQLVFVFITNLHSLPDILRALLQLALWLVLVIGFFLIKKWAWAGIFVLLLFSALNIIYALLSQRHPFSLLALVPLVIAALLVWALTVPGIRALFQIEKRKDKNVPAEIAVFALICFVCALMLILELFGPNHIAFNALPGKLFVGFLAFLFALLGIGLWQANKTAMQSTHSILIFTLLVTTFVLLYDLYTSQRSLALPNAIFYIAASLFMLLFWVKCVMHKKNFWLDE